MIIHLTVAIHGTELDDAWSELDHPDGIQDAWFGVEEGTGGSCRHGLDEPHEEGEWCGARVEVPDTLAGMILDHYRRQSRVIEIWSEKEQP